jgi:hypothetical protein
VRSSWCRDTWHADRMGRRGSTTEKGERWTYWFESLWWAWLRPSLCPRDLLLAPRFRWDAYTFTRCERTDCARSSSFLGAPRGAPILSFVASNVHVSYRGREGWSGQCLGFCFCGRVYLCARRPILGPVCASM